MMLSLEFTDNEARMLMNYLDRADGLDNYLLNISEYIDGDKPGELEALLKRIVKSCREHFTSSLRNLP